MLNTLFGAVTLAATLRLATPLIFAAVGGCFGNKAGVFNIALESFMLTAAFFSAYGTYLTVNPYIGVLFGILAGVLCAVLFGVFVFHLESDGMVVSIAMNLGAWGLTTLSMLALFGVRGSFMDPRLVSLPTVHMPFLEGLGIVNKVFNDQNILVYLAFLSILVMWVIMYRTPFGLRTRGVGINEKAAQTTGTNVLAYRWYATLITGVFCGVAGAVLPLGGTSVFSENMTAGRGFLAVAAILVGQGNPAVAAASCLLFAYASALSVGIQNLGIPSQLVETLPYVATILVLLLYGSRNLYRKKKADPEKTQ